LKTADLRSRIQTFKTGAIAEEARGSGNKTPIFDSFLVFIVFLMFLSVAGGGLPLGSAA
jgi:hypothetical protein